MAHSVLGASKAHRWITCPGSVKLEETFPDTTSPAAAEGTAAHALAEVCLTMGIGPEQYIGSTVEDHLVDEHMARHVATYIDHINMNPGVHYFEVRVDYSAYAPGGYGTADCLSFADGVMRVIDLKYGVGVKVFAQDNAQLKLYALGAFLEHGFDYQVDVIEMTIVQPRLDHIDSFTMRVKDLLAWARNVVKPAAELALQDDAPFKPSESACRFCKAKSSCRALAEHNLKAVQGEFENLDEALEQRKPDTLNPEELAELLEKADLITSWATSLKEHATTTLFNGGVIPGYKVVSGRSHRKWADDEKAAYEVHKLLGQAAFTSRLRSPAQVEKLLGRKDSGEIADLIVKPEGKPTLVPDSDPRPAVGAAFNDLNEE